MTAAQRSTPYRGRKLESRRRRSKKSQRRRKSRRSSRSQTRYRASPPTRRLEHLWRLLPRIGTGSTLKKVPVGEPGSEPEPDSSSPVMNLGKRFAEVSDTRKVTVSRLKDVIRAEFTEEITLLRLQEQENLQVFRNMEPKNKIGSLCLVLLCRYWMMPAQLRIPLVTDVKNKGPIKPEILFNLLEEYVLQVNVLRNLNLKEEDVRDLLNQYYTSFRGIYNAFSQKAINGTEVAKTPVSLRWFDGEKQNSLAYDLYKVKLDWLNDNGHYEQAMQKVYGESKQEELLSKEEGRRRHAVMAEARAAMAPAPAPAPGVLPGGWGEGG